MGEKSFSVKNRIRTIEIIGLPANKLNKKNIGFHLPPSVKIEKERSSSTIKIISDLSVSDEWKLEIY